MRVSTGSLPGGAFGAVGVIAVVVAGLILVPKLIDDAAEEATAGHSFKETLPEMIEDFGEEAKVVSVAEIGGTVSWAVIDSEGTLHERRYSTQTSELRGPQGQPAQGREEQVDDSERPATEEEIASAKVTLGELDPEVVERMWEEVGFPTQGSSASLTGEVWALSSGSRAFDRYLADVDGGNIRQTQSKEETFGKPPEQQVGSVKQLGECIEAAGSDIAAIQKCQAGAQ